MTKNFMPADMELNGNYRSYISQIKGLVNGLCLSIMNW